jgi:type II secretory pathway pseudopilin PulG
MNENRRPALMRAQSHRGATLLELLAVILILLMITAMSIPAVTPAVSGRRTREGARMVSAFLNAARNRAIETGRPAGVWIERFPGLPESASSLYMAEIPPTYSGDFLDSTVECVIVGPDGLPYDPWARNHRDFYNLVIPRSRTTFLTDAWSNPDPQEQQLVREGDLLQLDGYDRMYPLKVITQTPTSSGGAGGPPLQLPGRSENKWWYIVRGRNCSATTGPNGAYTNERYNPSLRYVIRWFDRSHHLGQATNATVQSTDVPLNFDRPGIRYKIYRQPMRLQAGAIRLPDTVVIDLNFSGMTNGLIADSGLPFHPRQEPAQTQTASALRNPYWGDSVYPDDTTPIVIVFSASGHVERVYCHQRDALGNWNWEGVEAYGPIYLLVGDRAFITGEAFRLSQSANENMEIQFNKNWLNLDALWVRITPNTGDISTSLVEDIAYLTTDSDAKYVCADPSNVRLARANKAQYGRTVGGR